MGRLLGLLLRTGLPLIRNILKPLAKNVLILLGLTAATLATDAAIHKKMIASDTRLSGLAKRFSTKEMNDIMKIIKSLEESVLLIKGVSEAMKNEAKKQKGRFLGMLLHTLDASLLGNSLTDKVTIRAGEGAVRVGQDF